jgi:radical SAM/Cys-rich protein
MHATYPLLVETDFPPLRRAALEVLQVNLGYYCNQSCLHCHVAASPKRTEVMSEETTAQVIEFIQRSGVHTLDLTGGAPELMAPFRPLVEAGRARGLRVIDRCNLSVLLEPGQEDLADYLAAQRVDVTASMPCYLEENVDAQRGDGVFTRSIEGLRRLNARGYGDPGSALRLDLVYNPQGPSLPPPQQALEADYKAHLEKEYGVRFNSLLTLANMPIQRFGSTLVSRGQFADYMQLLRAAHSVQNLPGVMCRSTLSVDYQGYLFDCDFNQMLNIPLGGKALQRTHITSIYPESLKGKSIAVADHCYGCTAGQGSSCGGALS